jgi:hypothetical protein
MYKALQQAHTLAIAMNEALKTTPTGNRQGSGIHVYRVSAANKTAMVLTAVIVFWLAGWSCAGLFVPHVRTRLAHEGLSITAEVVLTLALFGLALFSAIWPFRMQVRITNSQVEVTEAFSSHTIPFADISGRRLVAGRGGGGIYIYRRGRSRVLVRESSFRLDDFYMRWQASINDLDKADRLKRKADGKERPFDWFFDNSEQHPAIGGPDDVIA